MLHSLEALRANVGQPSMAHSTGAHCMSLCCAAAALLRWESVQQAAGVAEPMTDEARPLIFEGACASAHAAIAGAHCTCSCTVPESYAVDKCGVHSGQRCSVLGLCSLEKPRSCCMDVPPPADAGLTSLKAKRVDRQRIRLGQRPWRRPYPSPRSCGSCHVRCLRWELWLALQAWAAWPATPLRSACPTCPAALCV